MPTKLLKLNSKLLKINNKLLSLTTDSQFELQLTLTGTSQSFTIPMLGGYNYNYSVTWGDGSGNTVTSSGDTGATHIYANTNNPYSDWFLPSKDELNVIYTQLYSLGVGGYPANWYWSSSEQYSEGAYAQFFSTGVQSSMIKTLNMFNIPCRSFTGGTYSLRDIGPAGGLIFITGATYYEAGSMIVGANPWSNITGATSNATGTTIGTGQANTTLIINQSGHTTSAAKLCDDLITYVNNYTMSISGLCETFYVNNGGTAKLAITKILNWGNIGLKSVSFYGCSNLNSIVADTQGCLSGLTSFVQTFKGCSTLTSIPTDLFRYCTSVTTFEQTFSNNTKLTSIPTDLFRYCTNVTTFSSTFLGCSSLTGIISGLFQYNTNVTTFQDTFDNCTGITTIPANLFDNCMGVTNFVQTFIYCSGLTSIPVDLFKYCTGVTNFSSTFSSCSLLTTIPTDIFRFNTRVNTFNATFMNCSTLTGITLGIFNYNTNVTSFASVFYACSGITSIPCTSDWFMPSKDELNQMYVQLKANGIGDLASTNYWSSSEEDSSIANYQSFSGGALLSTYKTYVCYVRACRSFTGGTYSLRDTGPAGGWIFITGATYYECAPTDQSTGQTWSNITGVTSNATGTTIGTGQLNTTTIIGQSGHTDSAAKLCDDYVFNLFDACTGVTNFNAAFSSCSKLTTVPTDIFKFNSRVLTFNQTFYGCVLLTGVTTIFNYNTNVTSFDNLFSFCSVLASIPSSLFDNCTGVTSFYATFSYCPKLASIPTDLFKFNTLNTTFWNTFVGNYSLSTIPTDLFKYTINVTSFENTFQLCTGITAIPYTLFDYCTGITNFINTFQACSALTGDAPPIWNRTGPIPTGTTCFSSCTTLDNYSFIPTNWGGIYDSTLKLQITTTGATQSVTIPMTSGAYTYNYFVNWGDGSGNTVTSSGDTGATHIYASASAYTMTISGACPTISVEYAGTMRTTITKIYQWGSTGLNKANFQGCTNLTSIVTDWNKSLSLITNFNNSFGSCSALSIIPDRLFDYCTGTTDFSNTFEACTIIISIPANLFKYTTKVTSFSNTFRYCQTLTGITPTLFDTCPLVATVRYVFENCSGLTSIPAGLFSGCTGITEFNSAFDACGASLTGNAPTYWLRSPTPTGTYCFRGDTNLTNYAAAATAGWT